MSPEDYTDAVDYVAAQLTQDQFATYFERVASMAQGYEYRLKSYVATKGGKGQTSIVYVDAPLDGRAKLLVTNLKQAIVSKWNGGPNPRYNATVAEAKKIQH